MSKRLTSEQKAANKARRRLQQEKESWQIYRKWQGENLDKIRPGQEIRSFHEFQAIYNDESVGRKIATIKYEVQYQMSQKTFRAISAQYEKQLQEDFNESYARQRGIGIADVDVGTASYKKTFRQYVKEKKPAEFSRKQSTRDLATFIKGDIYRFKANLMDNNPDMSKKEISKAVSTYFFGS